MGRLWGVFAGRPCRSSSSRGALPTRATPCPVPNAPNQPNAPPPAPPVVNYFEASCERIDLDAKVAYCTSKNAYKDGRQPQFEVPYDILVVSACMHAACAAQSVVGSAVQKLHGCGACAAAGRLPCPPAAARPSRAGVGGRAASHVWHAGRARELVGRAGVREPAVQPRACQAARGAACADLTVACPCRGRLTAASS